MKPQTDPWKDFFEVYLDLGHAIQAEIARDPLMAVQAAELELFLKQIRHENNPTSTNSKEIVHEVIKRFRGNSRQILLRESKYFDNELFLFPGVSVDVAELWRNRPLYRDGLWQWIEHCYIIGNVCLHPNRKDVFLNAVKQLKATARGQPIVEQPQQEENMDSVVDQMAAMFGMDSNPAMKGVMAKMAKKLHGTMSGAENPMALLQSIVSGDLSALGDLEQEIQQDIEKSIEKGELSEADFEKSREGMMQQFGGMEGLMQMAQGMGIQAPNTGQPADYAAQYTNANTAPAPNQRAPVKTAAKKTQPTTGQKKKSAPAPQQNKRK